MSDLTDGLDALTESRSDYEKAQRYYRGAIPEVFASPRMRALLKRSGISYKVNFCKLPVKVLANRLRIAAVTASTPDAQTVLDRMWKANRMNLKTKVIHPKVGMFGDGYLTVWPNRSNTEVDIRFNSPLTTRMIYDPEDEDTPLYVVRQWVVNDDFWRSVLAYDGHTERYASTDKGKTWKPYVDPIDGLAEFDHDFGLPFYHLRTGMPYGEPDHVDAFGIQDAINKLVTVQMGNVDFYGFPQRAALLDIRQSDEMDREDLWEDETPGAGEDTDGQAATIASSPEKMWLLNNVRQLVQLPGADPTVFIAPFLLFVRAMAQVTETPVRHLDPQGDVPSGESQRASDAPLTMRVEDRQEMLAATYEDALTGALRMSASLEGGTDLGDVSVDVRWSPSAQTDQTEDWTVAAAKLKAGVPPRVVLTEAGYAPEQVDTWIRDTPVIELMPRVDFLVKVAAAAQGLGASSALGVVDPGLVQQAIAAVTGVGGGRQAA